MKCRIDKAIEDYLSDRSASALSELDAALVSEDFCVPVGEVVRELSPGKFDVPAVCTQTEDGGALLAFSTLAHLQEWKPEGIEYTKLSGRSVITLARGIPAVSLILINPGSAPRGLIPRSDFDRMLAKQ